ncbi:recombinase family protein [Paenibacillus piri]|nr:recombinase family protein [Paenibacillus piri]
MKFGYVRARTKKEINSFYEQVKPDELFVDLANAFGESEGLQLAKMLKTATANDTIVFRGFSQLADSTEELSKLLSTLLTIDAKLTILDEEDGGLLMNDLSLKVVDYIYRFEAAKEKAVFARETKTGRKAMEYPTNFYDVYKDYASGSIKAAKAIELLGLKNRAKFYELVRMFEA